MLNELKIESNITRTENGAVTPESTGSDCLDLFATIGALRCAEQSEILNRFYRAFIENPSLALKILFFARDVRGGLGERRIFRVIIKSLAERNPKVVLKNIRFIAEFGRFDDLLALFDTECECAMFELIREQLSADLVDLENNKPVSLLGKWLPSVNTSNNDAVVMGKRIAKALDMSDSEYRKALSKLRERIKIIENNLRTHDYSFDYQEQPSKALFKYRQAFLRNDSVRYESYLDDVANGKAKMNTGTLYPYEMVSKCFENIYEFKNFTEEEKKALDVTWNALPDYTLGENALVVVDGSGSMYTGDSPAPIDVALSLGIYFAERNKGAFHNHFITFSERPRLIQIKGNTITDKVAYCATFDEPANTNLERVFQLILNTAVKSKLPQSELPAKLYIISDMEFDCCVYSSSLSNFENAKKLFAENGYTLPTVIFWNVASRNRHQPVKQNEQGVALVSGCSSRTFSMVTGGILDPYSFMIETLSNERYSMIKA